MRDLARAFHREHGHPRALRIWWLAEDVSEQSGRRHDQTPRMFTRYRRHAYVAFLALVLTSSAALYRSQQATDRAADQAAAIQQSRVNSSLTSCEEQNARHDNAIVALDKLLKRAARQAPTTRIRQIRQSRMSTVLLINALQPHRNCRALVRNRIALP